MKKYCITILFILISVVTFAQSEVTSDSIHFSPPANRGFGDFILDINMPSVPQMPKLDTYQLLGPDMTKDYSLLLQLDPKLTLNQGYMPTMFPLSGYRGYGSWGYFSPTQPLQSATFKLNGNLQLTTFGQYKWNGTKMPNTHIFPWDRNSFVGGMELRNKNFGVRIEVRRNSREPMFPYYP